MSEFTRKPDTEDIFEGTSDQAIEIALRLNDDFDQHFDRNQENTLKFEQVLQKIYGKNLVCFFQKQKEFDRIDKVTGRLQKQSTHKVIIPIGEEKAIEGTLSLFQDEYSYRVVKLRQAIFLNPPSKNTIKRNCKITFRQFKDYRGFIASEKFKELYLQIDQLQIPILDINKEKDKQIWKNYVVALKKLVKQKEQVWKIQNIKAPYSEQRENETERANYIDIFINEKDLIDQLEKDIEDLFNPDELEDYGVSEDKAFIEFKNYRELNQEELNQLKELGEELFYELSVNSPTHYVSGEIAFKYSDNISKEEIFAEIKSKLQTEYQLECSINNGYIDLNENDIPHLQKIIEDNFSHLLAIHKDNVVQLKVEFSNGQELVHLKQKAKSKLDAEGLNRGTVSISQNNKNLVVELGAYIPPSIFSAEGLQFIKSVSRFASNRQIRTKPVDGLELAGNTYQVSNASKGQVEDALRLLHEIFQGVSFRRLPTLYFFKPNERVNPGTLRNFKTKTDLQGKSEFALANSTLKISADSTADYEAQLKRVKESFLTATIETKPFNPTYQFQFKTDLESKRQSIINKIQNEIRKSGGKEVEFDVIKDHTRILFSYQFKSDDEREKFKQAVNTACSEHHHILSFTFENNLGKTIYELFKNETLELEKEKAVAGNLRQATFIYLTPEQREQLNEKIEQYGDEAIFREGIQIGKLIKKDKDRLKFRITDEFDDKINAREQDRIDLNEIRKGYIKPIFPGELTNIERMVRAMKKVTEPGVKVGYPVNKNLSNFLFDPNEASQSAADIDEAKNEILSDLNEPLLKENQKQLEAVAKTLVAKDMALIQGPPGTGKTTVIAEIIWQELIKAPQSKILLTSQTHLAVDNALERLSGKKLIRPLRIGDIDKFEEEGKKYSDDRIRAWLQSPPNSKDENMNADNAICEWLENVKTKCSNEEKYSKAVSKWKQGLYEKNVLMKTIFSNAYYKYVNVFAATCSECGSPRFGKAYKTSFAAESPNRIDPEFDVVIMDEASKATPPELVLPLTLGKKVVIIGDHKQLPPMIDENEFLEALEAVGAKELVANWTKSDYKTSQFEKLFKSAPSSFVASLETQFRMHKQIMDCINQFYTDEIPNGLVCGIKGEMDIPDFTVKASRWHGIEIEPFIHTDKHAIWLNIDSPEIQEGGHYYSNDGEVDAIYKVLKLLTSDSSFMKYHDFMKTQKEENQEIGIITFYGPQKKKLGNKIYPHLKPNDWKEFDKHKYENEFGIPFRINTVDKFQGMEKNILIISTVRSNRQIQVDANGNRKERPNINYPKALGFAQEHPRINVGLSRAKRLLIVIGNEKHFMKKSEYEQAILKMHRIDFKQIQNLITK